MANAAQPLQIPRNNPSRQADHSGIVWGATAVAVAALLVVFKSSGLPSEFPTAWHIDITEPVNDFADWIVETFSFVIRPASAAIKDSVTWINDLLLAVPFPVAILAMGLLAARVGGARLALLVVGSFLAMAFFGLWQESVVTLTIMFVSVVISVLIGIGIGIAGAKSDRFDVCLRPVLDAMQTMPAFVYLVPVLMLFGIGNTSAVVATIIYAIPPVIRLTNLGIRQVPRETVEAARSYGTTPAQMLVKVELPMARPSILLGVNQTVMMALSMVIFVALIGASGLGKEIWMAMRRLEIGKALEGGMAVVLLAVILDRFAYAMSRRDDLGAAMSSKQAGNLFMRLVLRASAALFALWRSYAKFLGIPFTSAKGMLARLAALLPYALFLGAAWAVSAAVFDLTTFPRSWELSVKSTVDPAVRWLNINIGTTATAIRNNLYIYGLGPALTFLHWLPWPVIAGLFTVCAWRVAGTGIALISLSAFAFIGSTGMWLPTITTLSQVLVALGWSLLIGLPFGVLNAKSDRLSRVARPLLDTMQTLPAFVYFPVVVMLFKVGAVSGIIATIIYAMPPVVRLTELGIRQVPREAIEAARSFGTTSWQMLFKVELPLALPSVMMGINQTLMMAFAMVAYAALIGADGLGHHVLRAIGKFDIGGGFVAGGSIVLLALVFDRMSQGWVRQYKEAFLGKVN